VDEYESIAELCDSLRDLLVDLELQAAHCREYIPAGHPAPEPVRYARKAAMFIGYAEGVRHVLEHLEP
jgi:hypothetical protein